MLVMSICVCKCVCVRVRFGLCGMKQKVWYGSITSKKHSHTNLPCNEFDSCGSRHVQSQRATKEKINKFSSFLLLTFLFSHFPTDTHQRQHLIWRECFFSLRCAVTYICTITRCYAERKRSKLQTNSIVAIIMNRKNARSRAIQKMLEQTISQFKIYELLALHTLAHSHRHFIEKWWSERNQKTFRRCMLASRQCDGKHLFYKLFACVTLRCASYKRKIFEREWEAIVESFSFCCSWFNIRVWLFVVCVCICCSLLCSNFMWLLASIVLLACNWVVHLFDWNNQGSE